MSGGINGDRVLKGTGIKNRNSGQGVRNGENGSDGRFDKTRKGCLCAGQTQTHFGSKGMGKQQSQDRKKRGLKELFRSPERI